MPDRRPDAEESVQRAQLNVDAHSINLIWERTQSVVALIVVLSNVAYAFVTFFSPANGHAEALMANAFFLVIGFYFGRTNHARLRARDGISL